MGRGRALLSAFPRKMLKKLGNPEIMESLLKHMTMEVPQQLLLTLVAVADDAEANLFATARSASSNEVEWLCHFQDMMYLLEEVLYKFGSGEAKDADARPELDFILRRSESIIRRKHLLFRTEKQGEQRPSQNPTVYKEKNEMVDLLLSDRRSGNIGNMAVIAIVGADGIGKTNLADLVYHDDQVKSSFELQGWVGHREELDAKSLAKITLDSFNEDFHYDDSLTELMGRLRKCLHGKKFLLVLDDIWDLAGWKTLRTCFADVAGKGSAVILTTREVCVAFEMLSDYVLSLEDSRSLPSEHATGDENQDSHPERAPDCNAFVRKLGMLPLADKEHGSLLCNHQDFHMWTTKSLDHLVRLEIIGVRNSNLPDGIGELRCLEYIDLSFSDIRTLPDSISVLSRLQTLKLSFCCYLRELPSKLVDLVNLRYLDLRGTNLPDTSLKLGSLKNLQTLFGFTVNVNSGTNLIELASIPNIQTLSITELQNMVDASRASEANLKEKRHLENLTLRWNQLRDAECEQALEYLEPPKQLKMLEILGCPDRRFPHWLGDASFRTLEVLHIRDCRNCHFLPPLGQLSSLKELSIQGCDNVRSIASEFYGEITSHVPFESLEILWFVDMPNWKEWILLDAEILQFPCLRELCLIDCPELMQGLPKHLLSLKKLEIYEHGRLVASHPVIPDNHELMAQEQDCIEIPATSVSKVTSGSSSHDATIKGGRTIIMSPVTNSKIDELISDDDDDDDDDDDGGMQEFEPSLEIVKVTDVSELCNLPCGLKSLRIEGCQFLESLPNEFLKDCSDIFELFFIDCCSLKHFADVLHPKSLRTLYIYKCPNVEFLSPLGTHKKFALLEYLCISSSCKSLESISINLFPRLLTLYIKDCPNLKSFSIAEGLRDRNQKLESLEIRDCPNLKSFPNRGLPTPNLQSISISNCTSLKSLPHHMAILTSLQSLLIDKCPELESFPDGGLPSSLSLLYIAFSDKLVPTKEWKLHTLRSLTHFEIESGCIGLKSFPDKDLLPRNLKSLRISRLPNLRVLNGIGLQHLIALETLEINACHRLYSLPEEGLPSSLTCLCIKESSILTQKLLYKVGADWSKIAHIPNLQIDNGAVHAVKKENKKDNSTRSSRQRRSCDGTPVQNLPQVFWLPSRRSAMFSLRRWLALFSAAAILCVALMIIPPTPRWIAYMMINLGILIMSMPMRGNSWWRSRVENT